MNTAVSTLAPLTRVGDDAYAADTTPLLSKRRTVLYNNATEYASCSRKTALAGTRYQHSTEKHSTAQHITT